VKFLIFIPKIGYELSVPGKIQVEKGRGRRGKYGNKHMVAKLKTSWNLFILILSFKNSTIYIILTWISS
jgi:hypothetical protein